MAVVGGLHHGCRQIPSSGGTAALRAGRRRARRELNPQAMGTPAAWTTNKAGEPAYYSLNVWGPHHWVVLVDAL